MGHQHAQKMKAAQKKAAEMLTHEHKQMGRRDGVVQVDLHGFHTDVALEVLANVLDYYSKSLKPQVIQVVTGAGFHSTNGAVIKPAVKEYLKKKRYSYTSVGVGAFLVTVGQ